MSVIFQTTIKAQMADLLFPAIVALSHEYAYKPGIIVIGGRPKLQELQQKTRYHRIAMKHVQPDFMVKKTHQNKNLRQPRSRKTGFQKKWQRK